MIKASKQFGIPARTLRRHRDGKVQHPGTSMLGRHCPVLSPAVQKELHDHIQFMEKSLYGLTHMDVRRLAYEIAESMGIQHPFNKITKMAGEDWMQHSFSRHSDLSTRIPEGTSLSRAVASNMPKVNQFFDVYGDLLKSHTFVPSHVWNMDETGVSTVQRPTKIMATKGIRTVGKMTSGERGTTVTVICAFSAAGSYLPPMFIYPRKRMLANLLAGAPPQSIGCKSDSGWTDAGLFLQWLNHFASFTCCSKDNPYVVILDGHHSHKTLAAVNFARENGIHILTLPPHSTHKLQPLDVSFFKSLKSAYNRNADRWMVANPGQRISVDKIATIFGKAYLQTATPEKLIRGFEVTGIWPYNRTVFKPEDFAAANVTEEDIPAEPTTSSSMLEAPPSSGDRQLEPAVVAVSLLDESVSVASSSQHIRSLINKLSPPPKSTVPRVRKRKAESAALVTGFPFKKMLEEKEKEKERKVSVKKTASSKSQKK